MAEKRGIGVKHNLKFDVKSGSNEKIQGSNAKQDVEDFEFGRNSIVKSDRGVNQLKVDVKSGSGETSKRLIAKDDVQDLNFRCYGNRTDHHASSLREREMMEPLLMTGLVRQKVFTKNMFPLSITTTSLGVILTPPQLFRTVGPFDPVYGPVGESPCHGGGTGRRNQPDSNKTKGLTAVDGGNRTRNPNENISTINRSNTIVVPRANETPIVVNEGKGAGQWFKKWLCLGWFANKQRNL
ncbi:hypothetical protein CTI12_AA040180 [Artemisia annua]|uniref:Uncharacterized protein n=1 Tax=Artemisia annua TaxID=35608 RepID=A0A2U1QEK4_ARTAN|nr:hypothetical protein CTI12_AA040180 [Artemisia annua]